MKKKKVRKVKAVKDCICYKCKSPIDKAKDNYVNVVSYNLGKVLEDFSFHLNCWQSFNEDKVNQRMQQMYSMGMDLLRQGGLAA